MEQIIERINNREYIQDASLDGGDERFDIVLNCLTDLKTLKIVDCDIDFDFSKLLILEHLTELKMYGVNYSYKGNYGDYENTFDFSKLTNLKSLLLGDYDLNIDVSHLTNLTKLQLCKDGEFDEDYEIDNGMYCEYNNPIDLTKLKNLEVLIFGRFYNKEITFKKLPKLKYLNIVGYHCKKIDFKKLPKLETLIVGHTYGEEFGYKGMSSYSKESSYKKKIDLVKKLSKLKEFYIGDELQDF